MKGKTPRIQKMVDAATPFPEEKLPAQKPLPKATPIAASDPGPRRPGALGRVIGELQRKLSPFN